MMGGSVVEITCIIVGGLSFILHMHRLRWFKKNFNVVEAVCISYKGGSTGFGTIYFGTYEYYIDGEKCIEDECKTSIASTIKPRLNEKCYVYVSKDNPKDIIPYSQRKSCIRMMILGLFLLSAPLILYVLEIISDWYNSKLF